MTGGAIAAPRDDAGGPAPCREAGAEGARRPSRFVDHERDLLLFQVYRFLSTSYLFAPVFLLFFAARGLSVTEVTLLNTVYCGTLILFEVPTGVLADRWGRKRAMVLGSLMMAAGCVVDYAGHSFAVFAVGDGLLALGMTLASGADSAYLFDLLRDAGREAEYRRREGAASAAKLVGTAVALCAGGWLGRRDLAATYLVTAGVCLGATLAAALLHERHRPPRYEGAGATVAGQIASSAAAVVRHGPLRSAVLFSTLVFVLVRMGMYFHQPYLSRSGFAIADVGMVLAGLSLVAALGAARIDALRRLVGERGLVFGMPAVLALSYLALGRWFAGWGIALLLVQSVENGVYSPLSKELLNREIADSGRRATVLSVESMARRLAFGVFAPVVGALVDGYGLHAGLYACAALGGLGTAALAVTLLRPPLLAPAISAAPEIEYAPVVAEEEGTDLVAGGARR